MTAAKEHEHPLIALLGAGVGIGSARANRGADAPAGSTGKPLQTRRSKDPIISRIGVAIVGIEQLSKRPVIETQSEIRTKASYTCTQETKS